MNDLVVAVKGNGSIANGTHHAVQIFIATGDSAWLVIRGVIVGDCPSCNESIVKRFVVDGAIAKAVIDDIGAGECCIKDCQIVDCSIDGCVGGGATIATHPSQGSNPKCGIDPVTRNSFVYHQRAVYVHADLLVSATTGTGNHHGMPVVVIDGGGGFVGC